MTEQMRLYPIGEQDFPSLRRKGSIYIDKTEYVYRMTHSQSEYMFLYIIFNLMGLYCDVEVHTARGRIDLVMRSKTDLYLIETKLGDNARAAMHQIDLKDYASRFSSYDLPVTKVAIAFDCATRTLSDRIISER